MAEGERLICASAALRDGELGVRFRIDPPLAGEENGFAVRHGGKTVMQAFTCDGELHREVKILLY